MPAETVLSALRAILFDTGAAGVSAGLAISAAALITLWWLIRQTARAGATPETAVHRAGGQLLGARATQEDDLGFIDSPALDPDGQHPVAVVADGMGGHARGEVASRLAVRAFIAGYETKGPVADRLRTSLDRANEAIAGAIRDDPSLDGMGTTLVAAALTADGLEWTSVGDSLLFLYRGGRLKRLNEDHSMAPVIAAMRQVDPEGADGMNPNELRSALVGGNISKIDASSMPELLRAGDLVLLASDGLGTLTEGEAAAIMEAGRAGGLDAVKDALLSAVEARGNPAQDNVSVALLEVPGATDAAGANEGGRD